ncbi:hypothetical protein [Massilia pseudoviolaceinigra]|uniref:hypothetical protein n=1 Tax=Massilia pseudoviolaceinigra TaxID=3057165 RepID=UPI002796A118|nr:hypothetical protein [Massilia sp. CCM 9206]MDQ1921694.1 hypothetical protein [Massilia sp. CCM 9206]
MSHECTQERFLRDVAEHTMIVIRDDGVNRHIRFKKPDSGCMHFDLITWPGYLCYTGDMGTYVFQRTTDMFAFFRKNGRLDCIDHNYWAEKIEAADRDGVRKFSHAKFQAMVRSWVDDSEESDKPDDDDVAALAKHRAAYAELREAVNDEVVNADDNSTRCYDAANDFRHNGDAWEEFYGKDAQFEFTDVWDGFDFATKEYTFRFVWCCYALAWGIEQYDAAKRAAAEGALVASDTELAGAPP